MITEDLTYNTTVEKLQKEFDFFVNASGKLGGLSTHNEIVKFFQQDNFYIVEKELFKKQTIKDKIISNRCKYLNKHVDDLTNNDILTGFKKSGIYYGYGHFNPLWFKWFIEKYNIKTCYDPCGGWGHRLLGGLSLDKYVYNDLSSGTFCSCQNIAEYFNIKNVEWHNENAIDCIPLTECEAIFTCPPYFNIEHYECGDFETFDDYIYLIDSIICQYENCEHYKYLGIVLREDLLPVHHHNYTNKYELNVHKSEHLLKHTNKTNKEYLFIWQKHFKN